MSPAQRAKIDAERLGRVMQWHLLSGSHNKNDDGMMCIMEAAAFIAREPWSDAPKCTCPVIAAFLRNWNDSLPNDEDRDRLLKPLLPKIIGTKSSKKLQTKRGFMALDWLIRVHIPAWLDCVESLKPHALILRNLDEIADMAGATAAGINVNAAGDAAWAAAGDAARAAAGDAAWAAAGDAARDAARAAAGDAAGDAARAAAWDAAGDAAGAAAGAALKPTTEWLQISAVNLVERMCKVTK